MRRGPQRISGDRSPFALSISAAVAQTVCRTLATEQDTNISESEFIREQQAAVWTRHTQHFKFVSLAITFRGQRVKKQKYILLQMEAIFVRARGVGGGGLFNDGPFRAE